MKRVRSLLFAVVVILNALAGLAVLVPQAAEAAKEKNNITVWRSVNGVENNIKSTNWSGRFTFVDPYTIKDNTAGTLYQTSDEITKKNEDYTFLWNGNGHHFYYRPVDAAGGNYLERDSNNKCVGIIVIYLNDDSTDMNVKLVQPLDSPSGGSCVVAGATDIEGSGDSPDDSQHYILDVPEDISGKNLEKLNAPYQWKNSDTLVSYRTNTALFKPTNEVLKGIQDSWQNLGKSLNSTGNKPYEFFTTDACFSGTEATAYLVITPGDYDYATMVNASILRGVDSSYVIATNDTEVPKCLYPDTGIKRKPDSSEDIIEYKGDRLILAHPERHTVIPGSSDDTDLTRPPGALEKSDVKDDCYSGLRNSLAWILCPVLGIIDNFIEWAERAISNQLTVDLGTQETRDSLQEAWRVVARFSSGILVAVALVMVISTALGSDLISPYALKKILPRLVIGAIGIWLSWALVTTYIDIMNDLGKGVAGIMLTPFQAAKDFSLQNMAGIASGGPGDGGTSGTIFLGLATAGILGGGVFGLLGVGLTALFAFLVAIFVLALRQAVIVFLVIMAPLGFAMWILPNTQKMWKLWSGTLNKLLLMYPMIMGLLAAGKIFAYITSQSAAGKESTIDHFLAFSISLIAYVAPYFFLPALFKAAGGIFSNLTGMVNNKGKGLFDKYKGSLDAKGKSRQTFKDQMSAERQARRAAGQGFRSSFSRAGMRAKGGQPITGGVLTLRNRAATTQRVQSSMAAAQEKLEEQQIQEETTRMLQDGNLMNDKGKLSLQATTGSVVQRRAAINRLMQMSDDENIRKIKASSMASSDNRVRDMWGKVQSSKELADAFKDSAPDILRGEGAFSGGFNTSMLTKASKNTYAEATTQYQEAQRLLSELSSGTIAPSSLSSEQSSLLGAYVDKTEDGKLILNAASLTNGVNKLQNAVKVTAASAKEATLNPALRAEFKTVQATEALKMLNALDATFVGVASPDIAAVGSRIDPTTGLR